MCYKEKKPKDHGTTGSGSPQIMFSVTKILDFRKRIKSRRIFSVCLNEMK